MAANHFSFESRNPADEKCLFFARFRDFARESHWSQAVSNEIELILEEWWTNLLDYALPGRADPLIAVRIESNSDRATLEIRDNGIPFDPTARPDPNVNLPIEERPIGGLGIYMIKKLSSDIVSQRLGEHNILRIEKDLARAVLGQPKE